MFWRGSIGHTVFIVDVDTVSITIPRSRNNGSWVVQSEVKSEQSWPMSRKFKRVTGVILWLRLVNDATSLHGNASSTCHSLVLWEPVKDFFNHFFRQERAIIH